MKLPELGDVLMGKYRLDSVLGEGGFGIVYAGETLGSGRKVAVKVLKPGEDGYGTEASRFMREMKSIAQLQSPNTVKLYDYGRTDDGVLFMVCEHVDGEDLSALLARVGRLSEAEVVYVARQVLESLVEAHAVGLLHRDIKPSNIRVFEYGGDSLRVKMLDFGLARRFEGDVAKLTATGKVIGTPRYMAPERMMGDELTPASDLFSLGVVMFEAVSGRHVTSGVPMWARETQVAAGHVSEGLRAILNRLLAHDVAARYRTAAEVLSALRGLSVPAQRIAPEASAMVDEPPTVAVDRQPVAREQARWPVFALVTLVVLLAGIVVSMWPETEARAPVQQRQPSFVERAPNPLRPADEAADDVTTEAEAAGPCPGYRPLDPGVREIEAMQGLDRVSVWVRIPPGYEPSRRYRTILMLHEGTSTPEVDLAQIEGPHIRDTDVIVAPADRRINGSWLGPRVASDIQRELEIAAAQVCLDTSRLFAVGVGRGGMGVDALRCEEPRLVAAAMTAHRLPSTSIVCREGRPPLLQFHMTDDPVAPADGDGCVTPLRSLDDHLTIMADDYQCTGERLRLPSRAGAECWTRACAETYRWCIVEGGRWWKGTTKDQWLGKQLGTVFDCDSEASGYPLGEHIWAFFDEVSAPAAKRDDEKNEERSE